MFLLLYSAFAGKGQDATLITHELTSDSLRVQFVIGEEIEEWHFRVDPNNVKRKLSQFKECAEDHLFSKEPEAFRDIALIAFETLFPSALQETLNAQERCLMFIQDEVFDLPYGALVKTANGSLFTEFDYAIGHHQFQKTYNSTLSLPEVEGPRPMRVWFYPYFKKDIPDDMRFFGRSDYQAQIQAVFKKWMKDFPGGSRVSRENATWTNFEHVVANASLITVGNPLIGNANGQPELWCITSTGFIYPNGQSKFDSLEMTGGILVFPSVQHMGFNVARNTERALLEAGAQGFYRSSWFQEAEKFPVGYYTNILDRLQDSVPPLEALQLGILSQIENSDNCYAHPFFWSGIEYSGRDSPLELAETPGPSISKTILFGVIILLSVGYWYLRKRRKRGEQIMIKEESQ